jgi:hypothetical protein
MLDNATDTVAQKTSYSDRDTSPKNSAKKTMSAEPYWGAIAEAPLGLTFLPWASVETLELYPHNPEPVSSCEGMRTDG